MAIPGEEDKTELHSAAGDSYPCLEVLSGPSGEGGGGRFSVKPGKNFIGRARENDIVLGDTSVSRRHALLELEPEGAKITDLGSRNGIRVGLGKIQQATMLAHKARLKIGAYQFRYLMEPAEAAGAEDKQGFLPQDTDAVSGLSEMAAEIPSVSVDEELIRRLQSTPANNRRLVLRILLASALIVTLATGGHRAWKYFHQDRSKGHKVAVKEKEGSLGSVGGSLSAEKSPSPSTNEGAQPVFLDFQSSPIPAQIFFSGDSIGLTPFRTSVNLNAGRWYEARAVFQLPEVGEVVEEKVQFSPPAGASVVPVNFAGRIGIFKIMSLPRDAQIYLEGYFEKDPYRAKPVKFSEIIFGKPLYVPYGRYVIELRKSRQVADSQTFLDEVVYRREFVIHAEQTAYAVDVKDEDLATFPVQVTSIPPAAKVFIDDKEVGMTPYSGTFPVGEHVLRLLHEGYFDYIQAVKMSVNMPYVSEITLRTSLAGELINKADALVRDERFVEALPILVDAYSKNPSPRETAQISYLVGLCYLRQKALPQAEEYFNKSMQNPDFVYPGRLGLSGVAFEKGDSIKSLQLLIEVLVGAEDPRVRSDAASLFQRISPLKSVIYLTSEPAGARVFVNTTEVDQITPLILHDLGVGSYRVVFRKEGYEDTEIRLNLGVSEFRPVVAKMRRIGSPKP